jgi:hypothetical protein
MPSRCNNLTGCHFCLYWHKTHYTEQLHKSCCCYCWGWLTGWWLQWIIKHINSFLAPVWTLGLLKSKNLSAWSRVFDSQLTQPAGYCAADRDPQGTAWILESQQLGKWAHFSRCTSEGSLFSGLLIDGTTSTMPLYSVVRARKCSPSLGRSCPLCSEGKKEPSVKLKSGRSSPLT